MTTKERTQQLIDLLDTYGIRSKPAQEGIIKGIADIYEKFNSEVDTSKELPY